MRREITVDVDELRGLVEAATEASRRTYELWFGGYVDDLLLLAANDIKAAVSKLTLGRPEMGA